MNNTEIETEVLQGKVITFYSYKGGVGRSMSLVNIACLMAKQKKKVLLVDWDLEAPGLHTFFDDTIKKEDLGLVDLITDVTNFIEIEGNNTDEKYEEFLNSNLEKYIFKVKNIQNYDIQIDILKAGKFDKNYSEKMNAISWIDFYRKSPSFFRTFANFLEKKYNYTLIDSRTGLADTSGVCTMLMPQILILVFALNKQNIEGVVEVAKQSVNYRFDSNDFRNISVLPLPSRIDKNNSTEFEKWNQIYKSSFESLFEELFLLDECDLGNYFNIAKIPYDSSQAYGENIPVLRENINNDFFISYHYAQFLKIIEDNNSIWDILSKDQLELNQKLALDHFSKGLAHQSSREYSKAILEYEKSIDFTSINSGPYINWAISLQELSKTKKDNIEKECLVKEAIEKFEKALLLDPNDEITLSNLGNALSRLANLENQDKKKSYLEKSLTCHQKAIKLNPKDPISLNNLGNCLLEFALISEGKLRDDFLQQANAKYLESTLLDPNFYLAYSNWAFIKLELSKLKEGKEKEDYILESIKKCKKSIELNPDDATTYDILGNSIYALGKIKEGIEKEKLFLESEEILLKGIKLGNSPYNLSCLYAIWEKKEKAFFNLEKALINNDLAISHIIKDNDWINYKGEDIFMNLLEKYKSM